MIKTQPDFSKITELLRFRLGDPRALHQASPLSKCASALEVLIATVITQATNDRNAMRAWENFKNRFHTADEALLITESELADLIQVSGLGRQKARTIQNILRILSEQHNQFCLEKIRLDPQQFREFLNSIPGVGAKTTACTLLFGLNLPAFPVDIHINRIAVRNGWVPKGCNASETQKRMTPLVPIQLAGDLHILLLSLGRLYCKPRKPNCAECPLTQDCPKFSIAQ